jgi:hypothetical protein
MYFDKTDKKKKRRNLLKDVQVNEVSFVGRGANEGARQALFKTEDSDEVIKRLFNEVMADAKAEEEAQKLIHYMLEATGYMKRSLIEIMQNPEIEQRKDKLKQSVAEFSGVMASMIDNAELAKTLEEIAALKSTQISEEDVAELTSKIEKAIPDFNKNLGEEDAPLVLKTDKEDQMSKEALEALQKKFDEQTAQLAKTTFIAGLNDVEKAHYNGLDEEGQVAFEKMDADARAKAVKDAIAKKEAGDETFEMDGATVKKSEVGDAMFMILKAQQARLESSEAEAAKLKAEAVSKALEEESETLWPNTPGTPAEKATMLKAIRNLPKDAQETQMNLMKSADEAFAKSFKEAGQEGGTDLNDAADKLNKLAKDLADKTNVTIEKAYTQVLETEEGAKLYEETLK